MQEPTPPDRNRTPLTLLRICVWLVPGIILTLGSVLSLRTKVPWQLVFPLIFCAFVAMGYFDMRLKLQIEKTDPKPMNRSVIYWSLAFAFIQIIIAPAVAIAVIQGYLTVTDKGGFFP